ncbi:hypothetical protein K492DRAFT_234487 [Lichtheimia hyalospora FSU 10163]|nr:hypothetical protein K492DRAFT_234487 [Lichtheimia hyalospora FSU 10163]
MLAEQPCTPERLDSVLQYLLSIDCVSLHATVLRFLFYQLQQNHHINFALCFIRHHCCSILQQSQFHLIRDAIFVQALSLWNTEALWDLVIYRSLVALLHDLNVPSNVWLSSLATSPIMNHQRLVAECECILEQHVQSPSLAAIRSQAFAELITPGIIEKSLSIQIRIALYNALLPTEMTPLVNHLMHLKLINPSNCFKISNDMIQAINSCDAHTVSLLEQELDDIVEHFFTTSKDERILLWPDQNILDKMGKGYWHLETSKDLTGLLKECRPILGAVHPRFMVQITSLITSLMQAILQFHHKRGNITWDKCYSLLFSAWTHAFASWLDRAVFETCTAADSDSVRALAKLVVCLIACMHSGFDMMNSRDLLVQEISKLWSTYKDMRTLFLKSFGKERESQLQQDLKIIQTLLFGCLATST